MHAGAGSLDRQFGPEHLRRRQHRGVRAFLVGAHQTRIAGHIDRQNGREMPFNARLFQCELHEPKEKS